MASWEATALRLQSPVPVESVSSSLHKSLPPLPKDKIESTTTTVRDVTCDETSTSKKGWKPLSLSTPILLAVVALTLLLAAAVETVAQRSASQGGLALSPTLDDLPGYAKFGYLYVPTIIAVLYSMIWSWIDLDVKRMQPWFELSKSKGATGENSLFLDYQYEFVALVPFKAAKRKQWPVFFGGTAMVIVFWALTPLLSALLGTGIVTQTQLTTLGTRSQLLPVAQHVSVLDPEFLNTGYAVGWLDQPFPPFTTAKYALLPFYAEKDVAPPKVESNITAETTKLWTELNCWPAEIHQDGPRAKSSYFFLNGQGCNTSVSFGVTSHRRMYYIGYDTSPYSDFNIGSTHCPRTPNSTHQFLAIWSETVEIAGQSEPDFNITALFCQPQYYKQQVLVTVKSLDLQPDSGHEEPLSPRQVLSESEFNSTAFEYLLANGMAQVPIDKDWPFNSVIEQHPRLNYTGFTLPVSNMVGFALAGKNISSDSYADPKVLGQVYHDAHQYLFTLAVNNLLANSTDISNRTASTEYFLSGVIVSRTFATSVECLLAVIAVFAALMLWFCHITPSNLPENPSSINRYIDLFRNSTDTMHSFRSMDNATEKALLDTYKEDQFHLCETKNSDHTTTLVTRTASKDWKSDKEATETQKGYYEPVRPLILRRGSGMFFVATLIGAMVFLSYLKEQESRLNGLIRPSENFEVLQILENYIPTIFATLIEPLWVLLNRYLCVLQPFKDLWEGKARSSQSLDATYTSIPPQLVFWRAAKSRHIILVLVCTMALLANLLAVGLGSLFNEKPMTANYPETLQSEFAPKFNNHSVSTWGKYLSDNLITTSQYKDHMYVALANISSGTRLPAWVSPDYFFQPYKISDLGVEDVDTYSLETQGFGVHVKCTSISPFQLPVYKKEVQLIKSEHGKFCTQASIIEKAGFTMRDSMYSRSGGQSSFEFGDAHTAEWERDPCDTPLTLGWARSSEAENVNGTVEAGFIICYPVFETAKFNITVDTSGRVLSYNRTSKLKDSMGYEESQIHIQTVFDVYNRWWNIDTPEWHNDTITRDWLNYFITALHGNRDNIDPEKPVPTPETLIPAVSELYRRLFAIILSLNEHIFDHNGVGDPVTAIRHTKEVRIFMEDASFIITMTVLALNSVVAFIFYIRAVAFVLPRMPTTIGSVLAYIAPSRLASSGSKHVPGQGDRTLSFGRYLGLDGEVHLGIELDPHVVRIEPSSLRGKRYIFERMWLKLSRRGEQPGRRSVRSGTWL
ncbi:hypothetical protein FZEAL_7984 [Fusarium zealandicum]|uniref:Uncharacterized protein n=1 Tax=Fusarium zealandicum TaxID=1053134 RepID=A0A8H4XH98_9HYPO|nr:hypothetical protein FZEAL_7984 [Fusarium zealandicum]